MKQQQTQNMAGRGPTDCHLPGIIHSCEPWTSHPAWRACSPTHPTHPHTLTCQMPKTTKVKNKQPSDRQITAEQVLREAKEIQLEDDFKAPKQIITDPEELAEYRLKKRKEFEDLVRRVGRFNCAVWVKVRGQEWSGHDPARPACLRCRTSSSRLLACLGYQQGAVAIRDGVGGGLLRFRI